MRAHAVSHEMGRQLLTLGLRLGSKDVSSPVVLSDEVSMAPPSSCPVMTHSLVSLAIRSRLKVWPQVSHQTPAF